MFGLAVETAGAAVTSVAIMNSVEASNRSPCDIIILRLAPPRGAYKCYVRVLILALVHGGANALYLVYLTGTRIRPRARGYIPGAGARRAASGR